MKTYIFLSCLFLSLTLQAENPFLGKWDHDSGYDLFNKIEILSTRLAERQPIILFYNKGELLSRVGGELDENGVLSCKFKSGNRDIAVRMALSEAADILKVKIRMKNLRESATYTRESGSSNYAGSPIREEAPKSEPTPMILNGSKIEPTKPKEMELAPLKGTLRVQLEKCTNCKQYIVWLLGNGIQKPLQPEAGGQVKFSAIPFGTYTISVDWAGKVDRPDAPPYKERKVKLEKVSGTQIKLPRK